MIEDLTREFTDLRSDIMSRLTQLESKFSHLPDTPIIRSESPLPAISVNTSIQVKFTSFLTFSMEKYSFNILIYRWTTCPMKGM